jgi:hypothetical protein
LNFNELIQIQKLLFTQPDKAWMLIKKSEFTWQQIFGYYLLPLVFISSLAVAFFTGSQFEQIGVTRNQLFFITFASSASSIYISAYMIAIMAPRFKGISSLNNNVALIAFSYSPVYIASLISSLHEFLQIFNLAAVVFMLFLYFKGALQMLNIPTHKQLGFTIVSLIIMFANRFIIFVFLTAIANGLNA